MVVRKSHRIMAVTLLLLLVLAMAIAFFGFGLGRSSTGLVMYGNVDIRQASLGFRVAGRLQSLQVDEGDSVHAGMVLARLDPEPFQHALRQSESNAAVLAARAQQMHAGYRREEIAQAAASLAQREAALANAQALMIRQENLRGSGAAAARDYDDARSARDQARAQVNAAKEQLDLMRRGYRKEDLQAADAQLAQAQSAVAASRLQLKDTVLLAPSDGVILTRTSEPGTILSGGTTVFTLSLTRPVWVRAYVAESDLGRVAPGTAVEITTDSRPGKPYTGIVGYVSPNAEFTPKNVETADLRTDLVYRLRVVVSNPDNALRQGMPVTVRLAGAGR
jgi:HlyD family secretion protein